MSASYTLRPRVLGIYPTSRGMGWAVFEGPFKVVEFDLLISFKNKNPTCLRKVEQLLGRFMPETVVVETFNLGKADRNTRIYDLRLSIVSLVVAHGHTLGVFNRAQVREALDVGVGGTRQETADAVARRVPALAHRLPKPRRHGDGEDKRLAMFNAAALVLTHYHFGCMGLLDGLKSAA